MTMPDFLLLGAAKAGSTTLQYVLSQHPQIFMCPVKESGFFWAYGEDQNFEGADIEKFKHRIVNKIDHYQALFADITTEKVIGEASVRYLSHPKSPKNIHHFIPNARLLVILRQPADRAFSSFSHNLRDGIETNEDFATALLEERQGLRDRWVSRKYLAKGRYFENLSRYLEMFDQDQLHISLFDDLKSNPLDFAKRIFNFLDVDDSFVPDMSHRHNASGIIRNPILRFLWTRSGKLRVAIRPLMPQKTGHHLFEWLSREPLSLSSYEESLLNTIVRI